MVHAWHNAPQQHASKNTVNNRSALPVTQNVRVALISQPTVLHVSQVPTSITALDSMHVWNALSAVLYARVKRHVQLVMTDFTKAILVASNVIQVALHVIAGFQMDALLAHLASSYLMVTVLDAYQLASLAVAPQPVQVVLRGSLSSMEVV